MKDWPAFDSNGDLPVSVYPATLAEVLSHFGTGTLRRHLVGQRLERIYQLAYSTGQVARFIIFGSFVTAKPNPGDVDIFMLMQDSFESDQVPDEAAVVFDHSIAQNALGSSIFWIRRMAALGGEQAAIEDWQVKRDQTRRGIVEVINDDSERSGT